MAPRRWRHPILAASIVLVSAVFVLVGAVGATTWSDTVGGVDLDAETEITFVGNNWYGDATSDASTNIDDIDAEITGYEHCDGTNYYLRFHDTDSNANDDHAFASDSTNIMSCSTGHCYYAAGEHYFREVGSFTASSDTHDGSPSWQTC